MVVKNKSQAQTFSFPVAMTVKGIISVSTASKLMLHLLISFFLLLLFSSNDFSSGAISSSTDH